MDKKCKSSNVITRIKDLVIVGLFCFAYVTHHSQVKCLHSQAKDLHSQVKDLQTKVMDRAMESVHAGALVDGLGTQPIPHRLLRVGKKKTKKSKKDGSTCDTFDCTPGKIFQLDLTTDTWGHETSWKLKDSKGNLVAKVGVDSYADNTNYVVEVCLPDDNEEYTFTIFDNTEDGIYDPGGYTITYNGEIIGSGGGTEDDFQIKESTTFGGTI